jgi:uncharacterized membrane protein YccC
MAVVGKNFAILESGRVRMSGFVTWLVWVFLHLMSLPQLQNRLRVQRQWLWSYFTGQRSSRLNSRAVAGPAVIEKAEAVVRTIIDTYFAPNKTFPELRNDEQSRDGPAARLQRAVPRGSEQPSLPLHRQPDRASHEVTITTTSRPLSFAGIPADSWALGIRVWIAVVFALGVAFWLQLEAPSSAAVTVAILALPTRGQALEKACFRLLATIIGVAASIAIVGVFSQARDLMLAAFAGWIGLCVYASGLLDGNRAYAAVLSGYTVAFVAIEQLDTPQRVFETAVARGAAIGVGIAAVALVNDLLAAPDNHPRIESQLVAIHRRIRAYAKAIIRGETTDSTTAAGLLHDTALLRSEMASLATESSGGPIRSVAARSTVVALVAEVQAARALDALPAAACLALSEWTVSALDRKSREEPPISAALWGDGESDPHDPMSASIAWAGRELLRRDDEVLEGLSALRSSSRLPHAWRAPFYRSQRTAIETGVRSAACLALASPFFVMAGWSSTDLSLAIVAIVIGLGAINPNPRLFTTVALMVMPLAVVLVGLLEFVILDGVSEFPLLAIALAPFIIGATVLMTLPNRMLSALGRLNLIFILVIFSPSNPQSYNPQTYLITSLLSCAAPALLLAAQQLIPPVSGERRQRWLIESARLELDRIPSRRQERLAPEEAMFRDATRISQIATAGDGSPGQRAVLEEALSCFDQAAAIRLCDERLAQLVQTPLSHLALEGRRALAERDTQRMRGLGGDLQIAASAKDALATATSGALILAAVVLDAPRHPFEPVTERST